jgi:hypothetical protein
VYEKFFSVKNIYYYALISKKHLKNSFNFCPDPDCLLLSLAGTIGRNVKYNICPKVMIKANT